MRQQLQGHSTKTVAVVLAGGAGTRVGLGLPKQLLKVAGKTIMEHTLDRLQNSEDIDDILIVISAPFRDRLGEILRDKYSKLSELVAGGDNRNESTRNALSRLDGRTCKVLIHDAVRPFLDHQTIRRCVEALDEYEAVDVVIDSADTIVRVDDDDILVEIPDRKYLRRGQTPQGFRLGTIQRAYEIAEGNGFAGATDDCSLVLRYLPEVEVKAVRGSEHNMKITYPLDMFLADRMFQLESTSPWEDVDGSALEALRDTVLVVFGGSYGIGRSLIDLAVAFGARVWSFSRSETGTDIRDPTKIESALRDVHDAAGRIDHVVNAAALLTKGPLVEMSISGIEEQIDVNYRSPALIARAAFPYLRASRGHLLMFTSSSYTRGRAEYSLYSSTKAAVVNLTQALSDEWAALGVKVNCINPERTSTPMRFRNFGYEPEETLLSAESVARNALHVLTSSMTGQVVDVRLFSETAMDPLPARFDGDDEPSSPTRSTAVRPPDPAPTPPARTPPTG